MVPEFSIPVVLFVKIEFEIRAVVLPFAFKPIMFPRPTTEFRVISSLAVATQKP